MILSFLQSSVCKNTSFHRNSQKNYKDFPSVLQSRTKIIKLILCFYLAYIIFVVEFKNKPF